MTPGSTDTVPPTAVRCAPPSLHSPASLHCIAERLASHTCTGCAQVPTVRHEMPSVRRRCDACGRALSGPTGAGRPARFCGSACRSAAYRRRRAGIRESADRWPTPRGHLRLQELPAHLAARRATARRRQARERAAARRRAWRRWCVARRRASVLGLLWIEAPPRRSEAAVAALEELAAAAAACAEVRVRGPGAWTPDWAGEVAAARQLAARAAPPHQNRAERRRAARDARKAADRIRSR